MKVFITGMAGFIGFHMARALSARGHDVTGIDNFNEVDRRALQESRLAQLPEGVKCTRQDVRDLEGLKVLMSRERPNTILHLAGHAGIRSAQATPMATADVNILGHLSLLEAARTAAPDLSHLIYASSSSIYGDETALPFCETATQPGFSSLYAATKSAGEAISLAYAQNYGLKQIGLRLFTVYGQFGRPDMAYWLFAEQILKGKPLRLFNHGQMRRDMTHIDDVTACITAIIETPPTFDVAARPHQIFNIGTGRSYSLGALVDLLEAHLGKRAQRQLEAMAPLDVKDTLADMRAFHRVYGFTPKRTLEQGLPEFADWLVEYLRSSDESPPP